MQLFGSLVLNQFRAVRVGFILKPSYAFSTLVSYVACFHEISTNNLSVFIVSPYYIHDIIIIVLLLSPVSLLLFLFSFLFTSSSVPSIYRISSVPCLTSLLPHSLSLPPLFFSFQSPFLLHLTFHCFILLPLFLRFSFYHLHV